MIKTTMVLLSKILLGTILILGINSQGLADRSREVVIVHCATKFGEVPPGPPFPTPQAIGYAVSLTSSSTGAPVVEKGVECAQAVADVLSAGFNLQRFKVGNFTNDQLYILVKK